MRYNYKLSVPANTPANAPVRQECGLTHGVLTQIRILCAPEGNAVLHSRLLRGGFQLVPLNPEGNVEAAWPPQEWGDHYEVFEEPYSLILEAWNDDDTFAHTVYVGFTLLPQDVVEAGQKDMSLVAKILRRVLGL